MVVKRKLHWRRDLTRAYRRLVTDARIAPECKQFENGRNPIFISLLIALQIPKPSSYDQFFNTVINLGTNWVKNKTNNLVAFFWAPLFHVIVTTFGRKPIYAWQRNISVILKSECNIQQLPTIQQFMYDAFNHC